MNATTDTRKLYEERLGRYQAAIALEPTDRMPIATGSNYFAEVYSGKGLGANSGWPIQPMHCVIWMSKEFMPWLKRK